MKRHWSVELNLSADQVRWDVMSLMFGRTLYPAWADRRSARACTGPLPRLQDAELHVPTESIRAVSQGPSWIDKMMESFDQGLIPAEDWFGDFLPNMDTSGIWFDLPPEQAPPEADEDV